MAKQLAGQVWAQHWEGHTPKRDLPTQTCVQCGFVGPTEEWPFRKQGGKKNPINRCRKCESKRIMAARRKNWDHYKTYKRERWQAGLDHEVLDVADEVAMIEPEPDPTITPETSLRRQELLRRLAEGTILPMRV